jgi:hypothetical protein
VSKSKNLFKPLNDVCCFDLDGTLTTHTGNECTRDSNFSLKPNALTELLTVAKKGLFFIRFSIHFICFDVKSLENEFNFNVEKL